MMSYQVTNVSYHDSIKKFRTGNITVIGDSTFNVSEELGQLLFKGNKFTYKIIDDSLFLLNCNQQFSCEILELSPNALSLKLNNKYFNRIDMVKPLDKRRRITKELKFEY